MSNSELEDYHDPDGFLDRDDEYLTSIGFLCAMSGNKMPHEVFDDPNWPKTILFDIKVSNLFWKKYFEMVRNKEM